MEPARRLIPAGGVKWAVAILAGATLAGCGSAQDTAPRGQAPRRPAPRRPAVTPLVIPGALLRAAQAPQAAARAQTTTRAKRPAAPSPVNPDAPLPRHSPWASVLAVARRFAAADMSYEVAEVGPRVRSAISETCTPAFTAALLSHRASLPPGRTANQVRQRLVGVIPLERLPGAAVVLANVRSTTRRGAPGALELRLVPRPGGWRVAGLSPV